MDRALQIVAGFIAIVASATAQGEKSTATAPGANATSIILEPRPNAAIQPPNAGSGTGNQPADPAVGSEASFEMPAYSPKANSSYISSAIMAGLPKYDPSPRAIDLAASGARPAGSQIQATPGVSLLPAYIVRDAKIPDEEHILTYKGRATIAMNKYLGPSDGLDRGVLNRYTLTQLWQKIPILGALPFVGTIGGMSNEDRGLDAGGANDTIPYPHPPPKVKDGSDE